MRLLYQKSKTGMPQDVSGKKCIANNARETLCGKVITDLWYILAHDYGDDIEKDVTCKKCKDLLTNKEEQ